MRIDNIGEKLGFASVKRYGPDTYKLIYSKCAKSKKIGANKRKGGTEKMPQAISRARSKVYEYACCNEWQYFITLTVNGEKLDRSDLKSYHKELTCFLKNKNRRRSTPIRYVLVPELHKDKKNWHMHGLVMGLTSQDLCTNINGYLTWPDYNERFGFCSLSPIKSHQAVSKYILKYIGKGFQERRVGEHLYYCSRGLKTAEHMGTGYLLKEPEWDYENKYVAVKWLEKTYEGYVSL